MNNNIDLSALNTLSEKEKQFVIQLLQEASQGNTQEFTDFLYEDYSEIPVDIETFITDDNYLGKAWKDTNGKLKLYPFWLEKLKELFPNSTDTIYNTVLESGARGIGKSEIACGCICTYLMYRVMCLKNPLQYFHLKPTEKICFAFMNIKLELSEQIATDKFQSTIQASPWFMSKGRMTQKNNKPYWVPPEPIKIIIGSQSDDVIGLPIYFCLDGNTEIITTDGIFKIAELENKSIQVYNMDDSNNLCVSDACTVKQTAECNDYYEIELVDGSIIKCTNNHKLMLKDGSYKEAQYLTLDDELKQIIKNIQQPKSKKIKSINKIHSETPIKFYDVINANPHNNFLIKTNEGAIVSHNCFFDEIN